MKPICTEIKTNVVFEHMLLDSLMQILVCVQLAFRFDNWSLVLMKRLAKRALEENRTAHAGRLCVICVGKQPQCSMQLPAAE